eukprot:1115352-Pleurochrysis_carterae.AAC.2
MYKCETHVQSELKLVTLAVGTVKDNASGHRLMLGDGLKAGIAAEIGQLQRGGALGIVIEDMKAIDAEPSFVLVGHCEP